MLAGLLGSVFVWSYWPILAQLLKAWRLEPDYSHGFLVVPVALYFLWARRDLRPAADGRMAWGGLGLVGFALALRLAGGWYYIDSMAAWSLPLWVGGLCWLLGGWRLFRWALPAVAFLAFMIPLPYRTEQFLSLPLQSVATRISCWWLESFGQPVLTQGNVILLEDVTLEVAQACSGLRMFVSIFALAFVYSVLSPRPWWMKAVLFASAAPIAMLANSARIAGTGLLYLAFPHDAARQLIHEAGGWSMIPLAAGLMGLLLWYLGRLVVPVETPDPLHSMVRDRLAPAG
ncbi:MAG: exosortase/archaeosortase family protein [Pirellulales bacterium]